MKNYQKMTFKYYSGSYEKNNIVFHKIMKFTVYGGFATVQKVLLRDESGKIVGYYDHLSRKLKINNESFNDATIENVLTKFYFVSNEGMKEYTKRRFNPEYIFYR